MVQLIKEYDALNSELYLIQSEIGILKAKADELSEKMDALKSEIQYQSEGAGIQKSIIAGWKLSFSNSTSTIIEEPDQVPIEFCKTEIKPNVMQIKQYLKNGYTIPGCRLMQQKNFSLKKI
jgi:predicted  nucleic acid-binding Zn-ribbon protein